MAERHRKPSFLHVDVGAYGRENDAGIFAQSSFAKRLEEGSLKLPSADDGELPYVFVGEEVFQLRQTITRPYPGTRLAGLEDDDYTTCRVQLPTEQGEAGDREHFRHHSVKVACSTTANGDKNRDS